MPRRSGGGGFGGRRSSFGGGSPKRSSFFGQAPPKQSASHFTQQHAAPTRPGMFSGLGSTLATGMAFGAGSEMAHQAVRGMTGGGQQQQVVYQDAPPGQYAQQGYETQGQAQQNLNKCQFESDQFLQCLKNNDNSIGACQTFFDSLKECETKANRDSQGKF